MNEKWYVIEHRDDAFFGKIEGLNSTKISMVAESKEHAHFLARASPANENTWYTVSSCQPPTYEIRYKYEDGRFVVVSS